MRLSRVAVGRVPPTRRGTAPEAQCHRCMCAHYEPECRAAQDAAALSVLVGSCDRAMDPMYDVLVVGAGAAGLQCAQLLRNHAKVLIVDASDYVGGSVAARARQSGRTCANLQISSYLRRRIKQDWDLIPGYPIELGAELLHGTTTLLGHYAEVGQWPLRHVFTWAQGDGGPSEPTPAGGVGMYYLARERRWLEHDADDVEMRHLHETLWSLQDMEPPAEDMDMRTVRPRGVWGARRRVAAPPGESECRLPARERPRGWGGVAAASASAVSLERCSVGGDTLTTSSCAWGAPCGEGRGIRSRPGPRLRGRTCRLSSCFSSRRFSFCSWIMTFWHRSRSISRDRRDSRSASSSARSSLS